MGPHLAFCNAIPDFIAPFAIDSNLYIFLGDLNFHLENTDDADTADLLANLGLEQLVTDPTHIAGHTLDPHLLSQ